MTKIAASQRLEVAILCVTGMAKSEVAADYGVTRASISAILRNLGVKLQESRGRKPGAQAERHLAMGEMYRSGKTQSEVAAAFGVTASCVCVALKGLGVQVHAGPGRIGNFKRAVPADAHPEMVGMYKSGKSLEEVSAEYGITRERVRQILTARGVGRMDGGGTMKCLVKTTDKVDAIRARNERREVRCRAKWGMSLADYQAHVAEYGSTFDPTSPLGKYKQQRNNAKARGIAWNFTFADWWRVWQESGKWDERGLRKDGYVMARWGDGVVPYSVGTVHICTQSENAKESFIVSPGAERAAKARITRAQKATGATA